MRILFVSRHFPEDLSIKVHGTFKRFQMFIDAIKDIAEIDLLYFVLKEQTLPHLQSNNCNILFQIILMCRFVFSCVKDLIIQILFQN